MRTFSNVVLHGARRRMFRIIITPANVMQRFGEVIKPPLLDAKTSY